LQSPQHDEGVLNLRGKSIPQLEGEITICCRKGCNERRLECLNCAFGGINSMIMGFNNLQLAVVLGEDFFDVLRCLIIHDV
jgi:hypothetical protein